MIPNTERRRKPLLLTTKTSPPSIFTLTDALRSHHLRSSTIMAINDLEHREEEKASADDEDIGAQVVPIVRLEAIEVINGVKILEIASTGMATLSPSSPPSSPFITIIGSLEERCDCNNVDGEEEEEGGGGMDMDMDGEQEGDSGREHCCNISWHSQNNLCHLKRSISSVSWEMKIEWNHVRCHPPPSTTWW
uniref:Uncharacterized protein n=1 Tax=Lactuca sativa TaxID=4236 RepID=A0A9R1VDI4_LACSA|nr:hypothetical protein LSAT_V11C500249420 [Lactuca sativa]